MSPRASLETVMVRILSEETAEGLAKDLAAVSSPDGQLLGVWDASTGFLVRVFALPDQVVRWWIIGPMEREEARDLLLAQESAAVRVN